MHFLIGMRENQTGEQMIPLNSLFYPKANFLPPAEPSRKA